MDYNQKTDLLQDETLSQKLIKKGFWLYLFSYLVAPAGYLVRLLISNSPEVSVQDLGVLYSIISLIAFLNVYNDLGLTESLQYFLPKFWIRKEYNHIKTSIWLSLGTQILTSLFIVWGLLLGNERLANNYFHSEHAETILQYFCIYFLGINLFQTLQSIFIAFQKTFEYQVIDFVKMRSIVWFTAFCFFSGRQSIERYSLNWLIGLWIWLVLGSVIYFRKYRAPLMQGKFERDKPMLRDYSRYALWAFIWANVGNLFGQIIQQMVIYFLGAEAAGYYANFLSLFLIGNMLFAPIMTLLFPLVSELIEKKDKKKVWILCSFFYSYLSIGILIFSAFMMLFSREITTLLFGEKFLASGDLLWWFSLFQIFGIFAGFNFSLLAGLGKNFVKVISRWSSVVVVVLLWLYWLKMYWMRFAGLIYILGNLILWLSSWYFVLQEIKLHLDLKFITINILALTLLIWGIYWIKISFWWTDIVSMVCSGLLICSISYLINRGKIWHLYHEIIKLRH